MSNGLAHQLRLRLLRQALSMERKAYSSDVSGEARALVAPRLTLMTEGAQQRDYPLREDFNGLRWIMRTEAQLRLTPHDFPLAGRLSATVDVNII